MKLIGIALALAFYGVAQATWSVVFVADFTMTKMVGLSQSRPYCTIYTDRNDIQRILLSADSRRMRQISRDAVRALEEACVVEAAQAVAALELPPGETLQLSQGKGPGGKQGGLHFIYPGTKWCGPGNVAEGWGDVGVHDAEDRCCREHDHCPNTLAPGECRRGLCNKGILTRAHCDCDARFRKCLQNLNTDTGNTLGAVFFNVVQVTCFMERRPCSKWQRSGRNRTQSAILCSYWKYRPSDKYVSLMPVPTY